MRSLIMGHFHGPKSRSGLMPSGFRVIFQTDRFENNLYINPPYFCSDPYINNVLNAVSFEEGR